MDLGRGGLGASWWDRAAYDRDGCEHVTVVTATVGDNGGRIIGGLTVSDEPDTVGQHSGPHSSAPAAYALWYRRDT